MHSKNIEMVNVR